jgi:MoaA/NifB/PqqE/SkfB family radical SAM enzyme
MVTNGNLLEQKDVSDFSKAGLDEFILSMHGVSKVSYEDFMDKGDYGKFNATSKNINVEKSKNPKLKLRINYTFNQDDFYELKDFFKIDGHLNIDVLQLCPTEKVKKRLLRFQFKKY